MSTLTKLSDLPIVFISYDEENADKHYADLLEHVPWALRVHGIEGSDSAHKAAADMAGDAERFITIDADNMVDPEFFDMEVDFENHKFKNKVVSWSAINEINGLHYGNGGLKCWPTQFVKDMRTHENADNPQAQVDFCWEDNYLQMNNVFCRTYQNASARMAFRAGFREGCKMTLDRGLRVAPQDFYDKVWYGNIRRLNIWMSVGADVEHGLWSIYGARLGFYKTMCTDWDFTNVRDFTYLNYDLWEGEVLPSFLLDTTTVDTETSESIMIEAIKQLGQEIEKDIKMDFALLEPRQSKFYKATAQHVPRVGTYVTESDMLDVIKRNS